MTVAKDLIRPPRSFEVVSLRVNKFPSREARLEFRAREQAVTAPAEHVEIGRAVYQDVYNGDAARAYVGLKRCEHPERGGAVEKHQEAD